MNSNLHRWIEMVEKGEVYTCKEQKKLIKLIRKILKDEDTEEKPEITEEFVRLTEKYFFPLMPDQKFYAYLILSLFSKKTGMLIFNQIFIQEGRGWGKNGLISALVFFLTSKNYGIKNYDCHIVAMGEEQAKTSFMEVYDVIYAMGEKGKKLYKYSLTEIQNKATRSKIQFKTSNPKTKDGGRPGCVIFDEVHAYTDYKNIKVFTGGLGKKPNSRRIYITSDGDVREKVIDDFKERARRVLEEEEEHKGFLPIIAKLDNIREVNQPKYWEKANLRIRYSPDLKKEIEDEYFEMLKNEHLKEAFITKRMNLPFTSKFHTVCSWEDLMTACKGEFIDLTGRECEGAVDFADLRDFASAGLRWKENGITYFKQHTWVHEKSLQLTDYGIDIDEAVDKGWVSVVHTADYPTIAPELIANWFEEQAKKSYVIKKIKCDSFRYGALKECFEARGLPPTEEIRSGLISHNKIAPVIDTMFANHTVVFEDDKFLRWNFWNVKRIVNDKGNVEYRKIEPERRKTDVFFCFLHSLIDDSLEETTFMPSFDVVLY